MTSFCPNRRKLFAIFVNWSLLVSMCIFSVNALSCSSTLTAGRLNTCITREDGSVVCWGANEWGQLGRGFRGPSQFADVGEPLDFGSGVKVLTIALGTFHGCAILDDPNSAASGFVKCWGENSNLLGHSKEYGPPKSVPVTALPSGRSQKPQGSAGVVSAREER